jgi:hypothetical protein
MTHLNPKKVGLAFGLLLGGLHLVWSILVALNVAQWLVDFSLWAHMAHVSIVVGPFDLIASLTVIVLAAVIGFVVGAAFAKIWNKIHRS